MDLPEIAGEIVIYKNGCFKKVRRWLKGKHPKLGVITWGLSGWETIQDIEIIDANRFSVLPQ